MGRKENKHNFLIQGYIGATLRIHSFICEPGTELHAGRPMPGSTAKRDNCHVWYIPKIGGPKYRP